MLPICCLKWILQFAVFKSPFEKESSDHTSKTNIGNSQRAVIQHLVEVWSGEKFIQAGEMQLQSCIFDITAWSCTKCFFALDFLNFDFLVVDFN